MSIAHRQTALELYGRGRQWPPRVDARGRLRTTSGEERVWESVETILRTPQGTCPLDPLFGVGLRAYDQMAEPEQVAWEVARAIDRSEPRVAAITVAIVASQEATLWLEIRLALIGTHVATNRVYPWYRKA